MATYKFFPPVVMERPAFLEGPAYLRMIAAPKGVSLVMRDGFFVEKRVLTEDDYGGKVNGLDYFIGGYRYSGVPEDVAALLILSGYGDRLEPEE
jgi:hypothetical protein